MAGKKSRPNLGGFGGQKRNISKLLISKKFLGIYNFESFWKKFINLQILEEF